MEHQFFIRHQNLKLYRSLVAASEAAAAKADARQEKLLKLLAEEVANDEPPPIQWTPVVGSRSQEVFDGKPTATVVYGRL